MIRGRKGEYVELFRQLQTQGFSRVRVDGETAHPRRRRRRWRSRRSTPSRWWSTGSRPRSRPSVASPTRSRPRCSWPAGLVVFDFVDLDAKDPGREQKFSEKMSCPNDHAIDTDDLEPRSFSFNSPFGACPDCSGLGTRMEVDPELVVTDPEGTLGEGVIQPWSGAHVADYFARLLEALGGELGYTMDTPWSKIPAAGAGRDPGRARDQGARQAPQPLRPRALLLHQLRGGHPLHRAPPPRGGVRHQPRALRGLHARGALPGLPGQPAQAGLDGGHPGRAQHRRGVCDGDQRDGRLPRHRRAQRPREADRRAGAQGDPGAAALPARRRPRLPLPRPAVRLFVGW